MNIFNTKQKINDLYVVLTAVMFMSGLFIIYLLCANNKHITENILKNQNYKNIEIINDEWSCKDTDNYRMRFRAFKNNKKIQGTVCCKFYRECKITNDPNINI